MTDPIIGPARSFAAVLLDMDGTLVDSIGSVERSWGRLLTEHGVDPREALDFHGMPARGVLAALLPDVDQDEAFARIEALEVADVGGVTALPGAHALLDLLAAEGIPHAIVTSATRPLYVARISAAGLPRPDVSVTADEVEHGKPAPDAYLLAAARLGVDPTECLVVEDAPNGLRAGRAAGCATLAIGSTVEGHEFDGLADAMAPDLAAVSFVVEDGRLGVRSH